MAPETLRRRGRPRSERPMAGGGPPFAFVIVTCAVCDGLSHRSRSRTAATDKSVCLRYGFVGRRATDRGGRLAPPACDGCGAVFTLQWVAADKDFDEYTVPVLPLLRVRRAVNMTSDCHTTAVILLSGPDVAKSTRSWMIEGPDAAPKALEGGSAGKCMELPKPATRQQRHAAVNEFWRGLTCLTHKPISTIAPTPRVAAR